jgi:hypothetical protein
MAKRTKKSGIIKKNIRKTSVKKGKKQYKKAKKNTQKRRKSLFHLIMRGG